MFLLHSHDFSLAIQPQNDGTAKVSPVANSALETKGSVQIYRWPTEWTQNDRWKRTLGS